MRRALALVCLAVALIACSRSGQQEGGGPPPAVPVVVATAVTKTVPVELRAIGNVQPSNTVTVRARVGGILAALHFKEGEDVEAGQLLFTLDRGPLEAELRQAQANLAKDVAQWENARKDAGRYAELARQGFVAQQQADQARTAAEALAATVQADRAAVQNAQIQLGYATIRSPMTGRTGALQVHVGDLIKVNDTALLVINQLRPIDAAFALPERDLPEVRKYQAQGPVTVTAVTPQVGQPVAHGRLTFIDNRVDPATGTIQLKATFPNEDGRLWPGEYINLVVTLTTQPDALVVPTPAVQTGQQGAYVFVVKPDQTVESRPVTVARQVGEEAVIAQGLGPGETVVTEGQLRLAPGARVQVRTAAAAAAPAPAATKPAVAPAAR